jgi:hypothetical protein
MPLLIKYITSIIPTPGNACKVHFFKYLLFSSHNFKRGGATLLANADIPSNMIQLMGDWKSDAYKKYIVTQFGRRNSN